MSGNMNSDFAPAREVATELAEAYVSTSNSPHDPLVVSAYQHLQAETDQLFQAAADDDAPNALRIVFTWCREPYSCDRELIEAAHASRILEITTAATNSARIHPLLGCEYGGPFDRFRAIHDLIGHAWTGFGFDLQDEFAAWLTQDRLHGNLARRALATEILAVNSARSMLGEPPEQKAILLEPKMVQRSRDRIATRSAFSTR
jgi:hypothetical protein